jgi:hypothetical protein
VPKSPGGTSPKEVKREKEKERKKRLAPMVQRL